MSEKLEIVDIERKSGISSKTNKPYSMTKVKDGITGREAAAFGDWCANWKIGDSFEVDWKENGEYRGVKQWVINNPNEGPRTGGGNKGGGAQAATAQPSIVSAYLIAAALAPIFFAGKKKTKLEDITKLANAVLKEIDGAEPAPKAEEKAETKVEDKSDDLEEDEGDDDDDEELF